MTTAEALLMALRAWAWAGALVALAFLTIGIDRLDEDARGAYPFRLLLIPGILLLWPMVLWRWFALASGRDDPQARHRPPRAGHTVLAPVLLVAIAAILAVGLSIRQDWPEDAAPVQLSEAQPVENEG
ncbi:hypothetical protein N9W17_06060 [Jannaschia sp.]|nr:hypothetical protein [Jannaschia sp.]